MAVVHIEIQACIQTFQSKLLYETGLYTRLYGAVLADSNVC